MKPIIRTLDPAFEVEEKKPIEFINWLDTAHNWRCEPNRNWARKAQVVTLIKKKYKGNKFDLIHIEYENTDCLYLGHWNDGVLPE